LTETVPKCLVPIHGRPLLDYWLDLLLRDGDIERALVNTSYLAPPVRATIARSRWRDRVDLVNEDRLLGTGGTVLANTDWLGPGPFFLAHGDNLTSFDVTAMTESHRRRPAGAAITMMTFITDAPSSCGIIETDGQGLVVRFHEKVANPPGNEANGAVYIFEPEVIRFMEALNKPVVDLSTEVIPAFMGRIWPFRNTVYHRDIGTLESLERARRETTPDMFA
jgi:mannose-1-phosphate guanylyltransferase